MAYEIGFKIKTTKGTFVVEKIGCQNLGGIEVSNCNKCDILKFANKNKIRCSDVLEILFEIPKCTGCPLQKGNGFKIKGE